MFIISTQFTKVARSSLKACPQGGEEARLTFFSVEHFVWVLGLRVLDVSRVFVALRGFLF
jgi:hypothetical protein